MWRETPPWSIFTSTEGINSPPLPLIFSSIFLVFFYHISAFFFAPCYLEKFIITAGLKEKKIPGENILHWNLMIYPICHVWCRSIQIILVVVMFLSASPPGTLTVTSWLVGDTRSPGKTQGRQHNTPRLSQEKILIVLDLWPHIF